VKFVKQSFMGMELDILTGHPEHDILFIATQVARAAGLSNPSHRAHLQALKVGHGLAIQVEYLKELETLKKPKGVQKTSWLFSEAATYQLLLRGHAAQSEPFRKWVTAV
jgi:prophage antirepressor-like protein